MYQVHTGTRPGRPAILIVLCGVSLAGTLGLAWLQTRAARGLGQPVSVGTNLVIRPPLGWAQDPRDSGRFLETVQIGNNRLSFERAIRFSYRRWPGVPNLSDAIDESLRGFSGRVDFEPATIGPLSGVQVIGERRIVLPGRVHTGQVVYRLAFAPQGHEVLVEYEPVRDLTPGDLALLDEICANIRLTGEQRVPTGDPAEIGIAIPELENTRLFGPEQAGVPAVYIQGYAAGVPVWTIAIHRTWRGPLSLDELLGLRIGPSETGRFTRVTDVPHEVLVAPPEPRVRRFLVSAGDNRCAFVDAHFAPQYEPEATRAAARILAELEFNDTFPPAPADALQNGARLVETLSATDALRAWAGRRIVEYFQERRTGDLSPGFVIHQRGPEPPRLAGSFEHAYGRWSEELRWLLERDGQSFTLNYRRGRRGVRGDQSVSLTRPPGSAMVEGIRGTGRQNEGFRFAATPEFLCWPLELSAAAWVAGQDGGSWAVAVHDPAHDRPHARLMRPLPDRPDGSTRVLLLDNSDPTGRVLTFAPDESLVEDRSRLWVRERITADQMPPLSGRRP